MGGVTLDLRQAKMTPEGAVLDAFAFWGGIEIKVPESWQVRGEVIPLMGGFEDKTRPKPGAVEGTLVIPGLLPGMKLGLANIVVMYALFFMGPRQALVLDVLKALFVFLVSGFTAGLLSLCGGLLSLLVMWVLYYLLPVRPTWFILSVCGALAHNIGQLLGAGVIISSSLSFYYAPVMLVLGLVMGALTSITLKALLPALGKMGFSTQEKRGE